MSSDDGDRRITEAEYRAWLGQAMSRLAEELTAVMPREARDAGLRFEWASKADGSGLIPWRDPGIEVYDMVLPKWPQPAPWTPFRNIFPRRHSGKVCYALPSGNMVHVRPDCRC